MDKFKVILKSIWAKYLSLKKWQQVLVGLFVIGGLLSPFSSEEATVNSDAKTSSTTSATPTPSMETPTPTPVPTQSEKAQPESPLEFRMAAIRDIDDLAKDIKDARTALSSGGIAKLNFNIFEIEFNMVQIEMRVPNEDIAKDWNSKVVALRTAVDDLSGNTDNLTISSAKSKLSKIESLLPPLKRIAKTVGN